jgi:Subtilase family
MAESARYPLLNPVLRFTREPKPEGISGGGKNAGGIKTERLARQRLALAAQFASLASDAARRPRFHGRLIIYAAMFDDSLAPTWTPSDLFQTTRGARLITPYRTGYLVEVAADHLASLGRLVQLTDLTKDQVDISRVESVRFFEGEDTVGALSLDAIWQEAPETVAGRAFVVWLMPLYGHDAAEHLIQAFTSLRDKAIIPPEQLLDAVAAELGADVPAVMRRSIRAVAMSGDRINRAAREYRLRRRARTTVIVPTPDALQQLIASGTIFRIEPVYLIGSTSPGEGREPDRPLPANMASLPIVGVVDGGMSATSYRHAEAWRAPPLVRDGDADAQHGNRISSLIVQGHDWNNNLTLPPLYCQIGTVQAVMRSGVRVFVDPQDFITYLDGVMAANPDTRVWNFSLNQRTPCHLDSVSPLGHDIALLARKHRVLPVVSIGNRPGDRLQPPADCEAAVTIGGRLHGDNGAPAGECPVSLAGPGPSSMLKPDLSHFSHVRAIGGTVVAGSSFSTALTSPIAAHTMQRVREASPDLVKALLLHNSDGHGFDPSLGFGTPAITSLPWECRPGFVTLQWKASLRPGAAFYWDLPIPQSMRQLGKLRGMGALTAILNPHPMVTDYAGPNYFGIRLACALQYQRGQTPRGALKFHNLLGSLDTEKITEREARSIDHKWSPIRHHRNDFQSVSFEGDTLRIYARLYARDLYLYGYNGADEVPEMETVFVLSLGTGNESDDVYNELRDQLGVFVETAVIDSDIDINNQGA